MNKNREERTKIVSNLHKIIDMVRIDCATIIIIVLILHNFYFSGDRKTFQIT